MYTMTSFQCNEGLKTVDTRRFSGPKLARPHPRVVCAWRPRARLLGKGKEAIWVGIAGNPSTRKWCTFDTNPAPHGDAASIGSGPGAVLRTPTLSWSLYPVQRPSQRARRSPARPRRALVVLE